MIIIKGLICLIIIPLWFINNILWEQLDKLKGKWRIIFYIYYPVGGLLGTITNFILEKYIK